MALTRLKMSTMKVGYDCLDTLQNDEAQSAPITLPFGDKNHGVASAYAGGVIYQVNNQDVTGGTKEVHPLPHPKVCTV